MGEKSHSSIISDEHERIFTGTENKTESSNHNGSRCFLAFQVKMLRDCGSKKKTSVIKLDDFYNFCTQNSDLLQQFCTPYF